MIKDKKIKVEINEIMELNTGLNEYFEKNKVDPVKQMMCVMVELEFLRQVYGFTEEQINEIRIQADKIIKIGKNGVCYCE